MARSSVTVHPKIYQWLRDAYRKQYGRSPRALVNRFNQKYPDARKSDKTPYQKKDLISERTIQNFFKGDDKNKLSLINLNYLCQVLLSGSYDAVKEILDNDKNDQMDSGEIVDQLRQNHQVLSLIADL